MIRRYSKAKCDLNFPYDKLWELKSIPGTKVLKFDNFGDSDFEPDTQGFFNWRSPEGTVSYFEFRQDKCLERNHSSLKFLTLASWVM
ncbi:hypothetical protein D6779_06705 [Candidatus Parcubacteria bacterium]|nr:MAG: hypothetical protein D6779_06705 [Candidatus Parcubacteria bacterium]